MSEFQKAYSELKKSGGLTASWFNQELPACAREGSCNFTSLGGVFFRLDSGKEPVRDWLRGLDLDARRAIGADIKTLQIGWPVGMALARKLSDNLWELRSWLKIGIGRTFFTMHAKKLVLFTGSLRIPENAG